MSRWDLFVRNIQQDLKLFVFILALLCIMRIAFIVGLHSYLSAQATISDIFNALFFGLRLSLKSADVVVLFSFVFCTLLSVIFRTEKLEKVRMVLGSIYVSLLVLLFHVRIPFYKEFHTGFNQLIFNTVRDDIGALLYTLVIDYYLPVLLASAAVSSYLVCRSLRKILNTVTVAPAQFPFAGQKVAFRVAIIASLSIFMVFTRFGGSLTYAHSLHWENSAISKDDFLNEAIIDDIQALYRAYSIQERIRQGANMKVDAASIRSYTTIIQGSELISNEVDETFIRHAQGARIPKPKHIFIIMGESFAQWPLFEQFGSLHLADGMKSIISRGNACYVPAFVPNGAFTPMAVTAVVSGLSDVSLYPNYHLESYKEPYATAIAPQFKKLGYKTNFWYAGMSSWERIKDFTMAQGFDNFYGDEDFPHETGNVWGSDDRYLFDAVLSTINNDTPTLNVILTVSNHAPYSVDLVREGFDESAVTAALPGEVQGDKDLVKRLGHYWYTDQQISRFVWEMQQKNPESLIVVTGDHADRTNISKTPTIFERYTIPLVLFGQGITRQTIPANTAGSHINIAPTLLELIAPPGFAYYSLGPSLTRGSALGFSHNVWITPDAIGRLPVGSAEAFDGTAKALDNKEVLQQTIDVMRALSWWRIEKGKMLNFIAGGNRNG
ncbi:LTA synthase family protein [Sporomusa aerivorans]|uniref:LTA synthase family protein n=1 Tax=Sporomusa aerivorans TaxID=204936 RepID=UPI00352A0DBD